MVMIYGGNVENGPESTVEIPEADPLDDSASAHTGVGACMKQETKTPVTMSDRQTTTRFRIIDPTVPASQMRRPRILAADSDSAHDRLPGPAGTGYWML